ncbi:MAG: rod shape-determining protein MreC [Candidatus Magasanikbacteria bacterium]|nr:rod shape-determining protein MreC [Candidatus Magasanikbacteria bacterium]
MAKFKTTKNFILAGTGAVLVLILFQLSWFSAIVTFLRTNFTAPIRYIFKNFNSADELTANLLECRSKLLIGQVTETELSSLKNENTELRKQLNFKIKRQLTTIGVDVVGRDLDAAAEVLLVNRGQDDGVKVGNAAISHEGVLIGKVIKTSRTVAWVRLMSDTRSSVGARIQNETNSEGVVDGGFGLSLRMKFIPRNDIVSVGQRVISSGLEDGLPAGLLIGTVAIIENEAYQPFQQAVLIPPAPLAQVKQLNIIVDY